MLKLHYYSDCGHNQKNYRPQVGLNKTTCRVCLRVFMKTATDPTYKALAKFHLDTLMVESMTKRLSKNQKNFP